jgi:hypothetical protein
VRLELDLEHRGGLVFKPRDGAAWGQVRTAFASACKKAGIERFRFRDLRPMGASHSVMRGASLNDVRELLGHSDLKMTQRYAHLSPAHFRRAVGLLDGLTPASAKVPELAHKLAQSDRMAAESSLSDSQLPNSTGNAPVAHRHDGGQPPRRAARR